MGPRGSPPSFDGAMLSAGFLPNHPCWCSFMGEQVWDLLLARPPEQVLEAIQACEHPFFASSWDDHAAPDSSACEILYSLA